MNRIPRQILAFSKNSLLEALRNKVIYAVLIAAGLAIGGAAAFGALSLHQEERLFNNLVFFAGMLFLVALTIYQGTTSLHREIETKTIFTVLSKPVARSAFLVGKYLAGVVVLFACATLLFGLKALVATLLGYTLTMTHLAAYTAGFLQLTIILSLAFFFSSFSGPLLSALFTFCLFLLGSLTPQLGDAAREFARQDNPISVILDAALWVIPDLEKLNLSYELTHRIPVPPAYLGNALLYTLSVVFFLLGFAYLLFQRRDFA